MSDSWKSKRHMASPELPELLRRLAQALETGGGADFPGLPARDWRKLVLVAECSGPEGGDGLEVRLKAKRAREVLVPTPRPERAGDAAPAQKGPRASAKVDAVSKEKYRQLKKGLQADYKILERAARAGMLPLEEALESLLSRSEIMVEMDAKIHDDAEMKAAGAAFLADALLLREAFRRHDVEALLEILGRLDRRKGACHAQFK